MSLSLLSSTGRYSIVVIGVLGLFTCVQIACTFSDDPPKKSNPVTDSGPDKIDSGGSTGSSGTSGQTSSSGSYGYGYGYGYGPDGCYGYGYGYEPYGSYGPYGPYGGSSGYGTSSGGCP